MTRHTPESLSHLYKEYRRMHLIYGAAIIILSLSVTTLVWLTPDFQAFALFQKPAAVGSAPLFNSQSRVYSNVPAPASKAR